jgi:hypothetical protein
VDRSRKEGYELSNRFSGRFWKRHSYKYLPPSHYTAIAG